ncbi:MAG: SMC-Scp complex subunit ScpB [Acidobacteria bacterium]|nr:SMC-Scp complex subunit ScpB [Acidobacteriota bacterium]
MATQAKLQLESVEEELSSVPMTAAELKPILEALIYVAEEPVAEAILVTLLGKEHQEAIREGLRLLQDHYQSADCGLEIKEVAGGYKMSTKAEHHEWVRKYVKHHTPPTKLSLASLETLAVIAYRQPITVPEIQEVRGVNAVSVLKTLLDKKLITTSGRKNVIGRPILYRTTKEFLVHFGLKNLDELPSLEEFEDLVRSASDAIAETSATEELAGENPREDIPAQTELASESVSTEGAIPEEVAGVADGVTFEESVETVDAPTPISIEVEMAEIEGAGAAEQVTGSEGDSTTLAFFGDSEGQTGKPS